MKSLVIGLVLLVVLVTAVSWYRSSSRPSPEIAAPSTNGRQPVSSMTTHQPVDSNVSSVASDSRVGKESVVLQAREQTNSIQESSRLILTNWTKTAVIQGHEGRIEVNVDTQNVDIISQDKALEIALAAIGKTKYASTLPISIVVSAGEYRITFPVDKTVPAGTRYRGSEYAAEVHIDKKTGKIIQVRLGE